MHQRQVFARQKAVVDQRVLFDRKLRIAPLQIAGPVIGDPMAQDQVLRARRRADRVGLHEAQPANRAHQRGRRAQCEGHRVAAKVVEPSLPLQSTLAPLAFTTFS
jgi:hypothetical protein